MKPIQIFSLLLIPILLLFGCADKSPRTSLANTPPLILVSMATGSEFDGRGRFREIYCALQADHGTTLPHDRSCSEVVMELAGEPGPTGATVWMEKARLPLRVLVVSGLFSECISTISGAYSYALQHLEKTGYRVGSIMVSGRSGSAHNARQISRALIDLELGDDEKIVLVGYSKGVPDILEAVVAYPEIADKVVAVVSIAGAVGGSPHADTFRKPFIRLISKLPAAGCSAGDQGAFESLSQSTRRQWLSRHSLPDSIRYYSIVGVADHSSMSAILRPGYNTLAKIDPLNDGQLLSWDQVIPNSTLLGYIRADHWAIAMPFSQDLPILSRLLITRNNFPREILLEATVRFVEESLLALEQ